MEKTIAHLAPNEYGPEGRVTFLRTELAALGYEDVMGDLDDKADQLTIMKQLVEKLGQPLGAEGKRMGPTRQQLQARVAGSIVMSKEHADFLLREVRGHAMRPQSPHRRAALQALTRIDPESKNILDEEDRAMIAAKKKETVAQVHACCAGSKGHLEL